MSVAIETTFGTITVDLYLTTRSRACMNFLKLCKIKYYNFNLFHTISRGFIAQTGDPTGSRSGGESIYGVIDGPEKRYFECENEPRIKHTKMGLISFVGNEEHMIGSQFFITLGDDLVYLDDQHCVFGEVVEGFDILEAINEVICDTDDRPYQDVRITHTVILDDPFPDPKDLRIPSRSPSPSSERLQGGRIAPDEDVDETDGKTVQEVTEMQAEREAKARATILEMVGDIPDADMAPPENVLFVCKLNPVTSDDDLEVIFNRFGKIKSCEVIRDRKTGDSLQYAFIEFEDQKSCEDAYFKMDNILIDDRRIHVDFSQSVSKVKWMGKGRGVKHYDEKGKVSHNDDKNIGKGNYKQNRYYKSNPNHSLDRIATSRRSRSRSKSKHNKDRSQSPNKRHNSRYTPPHRRTDNRKHSRRSRSRSNSIKNSDRSRDRNSSKLQEKATYREKYYSKSDDRRDREDRNSHAARKTNQSRSKEHRRNRSESSESREVKEYRGTSKRDSSNSKRRSNSENKYISKKQMSKSRSSSSESEDDRKRHHVSKNKERYKEDEIKRKSSTKQSKSKHRASSNSSSYSENEHKSRRKSSKSIEDRNSEKRKTKSTKSDKKKKKTKSYESSDSSSSESDEPKYKKKKSTKTRKSSSSSSSDSDSSSEPKKTKKVKRKKKHSNSS